MEKKKAARSASVQIAIGSASDLVCMLALTAVMAALVLGGAIGQGSIRTAALCANALAAFLGSLLAAKGFSQRRLPMTLCKHGCISSVAAAREPAVCGCGSDGRIGGLFAVHWRGNPGGVAR